MSEPTIEQRVARPYLAIRETATMKNLGEVMAPLFDELFGWLGEHEVTAVGAPFWKYDVIDMAGELVVEVGVPVAAGTAVAGGGRVIGGELPAGRHVVVVHHGHPDTLERATGELLDWAEDQGLEFDVSRRDDGEHWVSRLETYFSNPAEQPDMNEWDTELAFKLRD